MKAKKLIAGAAALTLALTGAFAAIPAATASAADVAHKTKHVSYYADDGDEKETTIEYDEVTFTGAGDRIVKGGDSRGPSIKTGIQEYKRRNR